MTTVKKISLHELPDLIRTSYEGDSDILDTQHVRKMEDIDEAVDATFGMIKDMAKEKKLTNYKVISDKKGVGYFTTFDNHLFSFGINPKYRKKEVLTKWWEQVKRSLDKNFLCLLYPHQQKAIGFLRKNGMLVAEVDKENNCIILIHKN